eukprot:g57680.t1
MPPQPPLPAYVAFWFEVLSSGQITEDKRAALQLQSHGSFKEEDVEEMLNEKLTKAKTQVRGTWLGNVLDALQPGLMASLQEAVLWEFKVKHSDLEMLLDYNKKPPPKPRVLAHGLAVATNFVIRAEEGIDERYEVLVSVLSLCLMDLFSYSFAIVRYLFCRWAYDVSGLYLSLLVMVMKHVLSLFRHYLDFRVISQAVVIITNYSLTKLEVLQHLLVPLIFWIFLTEAKVIFAQLERAMRPRIPILSGRVHVKYAEWKEIRQKTTSIQEKNEDDLPGRFLLFLLLVLGFLMSWHVGVILPIGALTLLVVWALVYLRQEPSLRP